MAPPSEMARLRAECRLLDIPITPKDSAARLRRKLRQRRARPGQAAEAPAAQPPVAPAAPARPTAGPARPTASLVSSVLRQQQQRLLLMRHASRCQHENGKCPGTAHCPRMKRLWKHIAECKDQQCQMAHCVSSRYVLSHYHRCKDQRCAVCGPVRDAIQRNHEKAKQLAMAQFF